MKKKDWNLLALDICWIEACAGFESAAIDLQAKIYQHCTLRICIWASVFVCLGLSICICVFVFRKCFHPSWSQDTAPVPPHCKRHWVSQSGTQYVKCGQSLSDQPTLNACPRYCLRYLHIVKDIRYLENGTQCAQTNLAHMCVCQISSNSSHWKRQFICYFMMQNFLGTIDIF